MFKAIKHNCARSYLCAMAAEKMGMEWKADAVFRAEPPRARAGCNISHVAYDIEKGMRVWMVVHNGSGLTMNDRTDLTKNAGDDVIVIDIKRRGEKVIRIVNSDDQSTRETGER